MHTPSCRPPGAVSYLVEHSGVRGVARRLLGTSVESVRPDAAMAE